MKTALTLLAASLLPALASAQDPPPKVDPVPTVLSYARVVATDELLAELQ